MKTISTRDPGETEQLGRNIGKRLDSGSIIALSGPLGSGKTTLTKGIALGLDIPETVTSPTFTLVNQYHGRLPLTHIDVFRLDSVEEFEMIGGVDLLYDNSVTIIEWSKKIQSLLPEEAITISIDMEDSGVRIFHIHGIEL